MAEHTPHILIITMDELTKEALSCCGAEAVETPNLDGLAEQSLNFLSGQRHNHEDLSS